MSTETLMQIARRAKKIMTNAHKNSVSKKTCDENAEC